MHKMCISPYAFFLYTVESISPYASNHVERALTIVMGRGYRLLESDQIKINLMKFSNFTYGFVIFKNYTCV